MGARFFAPRSTCAVCGREVDDAGAPVAAKLDPTADASASGLEMLVEVTPGEKLVVCRECAAKE